MTDKYKSDYPLPGGVQQYFDTLIILMRHVGEATIEQDQLIKWMTETFAAPTWPSFPRVAIVWEWHQAIG